MPKVSVIIPCYNHGKYINEAVDSVLDSTYQDFEIIIINDGSNDEYTNKLLENYSKPRTKVLKTKNQGLAAARNYGIKNSNGEYLLPLDADDKIESTYIEKSIKILEKNEKIGFVYSWVKLFGDENTIWKTENFSVENAKKYNPVSVSAIFRKIAWQKVSGYKINMKYGYEDWDFWISLNEAGYQGEVIKEPLFFHRKHGKTMTNDAFERHEYLMNQMKKNHPNLWSNDFSKKDRFIYRIKLLIPDRLKIFIKKILPSSILKLLKKI